MRQNRALIVAGRGFWRWPADDSFNQQCGTSIYLKPNVKHRGVALVGLSDSEQQLVVVNSVGAVQRIALALAGIRRLGEHLVRERVVKEELRGKHSALSGGVVMHLEVNVDGAARVPAGVDRDKRGLPIRVGRLIAA